MNQHDAVTGVGVCDECGANLERPLEPFEALHRKRHDAVDEVHLAAGADNITVNVTREGRVAMNRIRRAQGLTLSEQVRQALDAWLPRQGGVR